MKKQFYLWLVVVVWLWLLACGVTAFGQTASNMSATVSTVGASTITLIGSVDAGNVLTFGIYSNGCGACTMPAHGTISSFNTNTGTMIYTPASGYVGADSFTFIAISTPIGGGTATPSSAATVSITVSNARTRVVDRILNPDGSARAGRITFLPVKNTNSPDGITPAGASVSATLDSNGQFDVTLYPSRGLNPQVYYQLHYAADRNLFRETLGLYEIPASTSTITLAPYEVFDTNLKVRYLFPSASAVSQLANLSRLTQVLNNGSVVGSQPAINFIPGSNVSYSIANNTGAGRVDVTISSSAGGGSGSGTVSVGLAEQLGIYASGGNTISGLTRGGGNTLLGVNAAGTAHEYKTIVAGSGITLTPGVNSLTIATSGAGITSLGGQTGGSQAFALGSSGTAPNIVSSGDTHTVHLPLAGSGVTSGQVSNVAQTLYGTKTHLAAAGVDQIPLIAKGTVGNGANYFEARDDTDVVHGAFGPAGLRVRPDTTNTSNIKIGSLAAHGDTVLIDASHRFNSPSSAATAVYGQAYLAPSSADSFDHTGVIGLVSATGSQNYSGFVAGSYSWVVNSSSAILTHVAASRNELDFSAAATGTTLDGVYSKVTLGNGSTNPVTTFVRGIYSGAAINSGTHAAYAGVYVDNPSGSSGNPTLQYGVFVKNPTRGSTSYSIYSEGGTVWLGPTSASAGGTAEVQFGELASNGVMYWGIRAADTMAANIHNVMPGTLPTAGQVLAATAVDSGTGTITWGYAAAGGGSGVTSLNGLSGSTQTFAVGTSGSDFNISSTSTTHTFNIPDVGASARGLMSTGTQTIPGAKTFSTSISSPSITDSGLTAGYITFAGTGGLLSGSANARWDNANVAMGIGAGAIPSASTTKLYVNQDSANANVIVSSFNAFSTRNPNIYLLRGGGSAASPTATQNGDELGKIGWASQYSTNATDNNPVAWWVATASATHTSGNLGVSVALKKMPTGSSSEATLLNFDGAGNFQFTQPTVTTNVNFGTFSGTWNNGSQTFNGWIFSVTDSASNAASKIVDFQASGSKAAIYKDGTLGFGYVTFANLNSNPTNGMVVVCSDCTSGGTCAGSGAGAIAVRIAGAWICK